MTRKVLKLARKALKRSKPEEWGSSARESHESVIAAIDEVLEQPEQEPAAWEYKALYIPNPQFDDGMRVTRDLRVAQINGEPDTIKPLSYTIPPQRKPLTEKERTLLAAEKLSPLIRAGAVSPIDAFNIAITATEAIHGIRGTHD